MFLDPNSKEASSDSSSGEGGDYSFLRSKFEPLGELRLDLRELLNVTYKDSSTAPDKDSYGGFKQYGNFSD